MITNRIARANECLKNAGLDAVIVTDIYNVRYLSSFTGSDAALVLTPSDRWLLTDSRYVTQAGQQAEGFSVVEYSRKVDGIAELLRREGVSRAAFEAETMPVSFHASLAARLSGVELVAAPASFLKLRVAKEPAEVELLDRIAGICSDALQELLGKVKPGLRERDLARDLEWLMRERGADDRSFDFIVASGERGALPHGVASERVLREGELITFDYGGRLDGYCSDETVTVALGRIGDKHREIHSVVREAQELALAAVRPGVACCEVDRAARDFIAAAGYGTFFGHGLGHGVGLEVHEKPTLSPKSEDILEEGMVVTVEPGIYIPGFGGVRIEDTVCVTADGFRRLTKVPKQLIEL